MTVRRGDIVLADLPYSDRTGSKTRPALVIQCHAQQPHHFGGRTLSFSVRNPKMSGCFTPAAPG
jgi:mRNA-degrading endonuclease toxin of MazEF toxin-antitoxin module